MLIPAAFVAPDGRFTNVHIDLVGFLSPSEGSRYCLTMIDRFSRWPEAVPLADISAEMVARAFYNQWISRYGAPAYITSDQGSQFESEFFSALFSLLGCERIRTTAYHPAANGLIERWHRDFKAAIMCHAKDWTRVLSAALIGLCTRIRLDTNASPSEFVYGSALRLSWEFFLLGDFKPNPHYFLQDFREYIKKVRPVPVAHHNKTRVFVYKDLASCIHVFMLAKAKKSLERPYTGPYKVLQRISDHVYSINVNGEPRNVSVELLKPAYFLSEDIASGECQATIQGETSPPLTPSERPAPTFKTYTNKRKRGTFAETNLGQSTINTVLLTKLNLIL